MLPEKKDASGECACGSGMPFAECCAPYLSGQKNAPTAEALMRSRYTAYTRNDLDYIARTWHSATRPVLNKDESDNHAEKMQWLGLEIIATEAGMAHDAEGMVEFIAHYQAQGVTGKMHEVSRFRREGGAWRYLDGKVDSRDADTRNMPRVGRNDPCPCGSGKKYKKCCAGG